jgi:putative aminopeptidase FrvX
MTTTAIPDDRRRVHEDWLLAITQIPTATGREDRVIAWIDEWVSARDDITIDRDPCGNLVLTSAHILSAANDAPPVWITAHLDHPAFIVVGFEGETVIVEFRGGVMADYFKDGRVRFVCEDDRTLDATLSGEIEHTGSDDSKPMFKRYRATLDDADAIEQIALIALENSRSFEDSPIGGGPIVRVGDRVSVFSPGLTGAVAKVAERIAGGSAHVTASQKLSEAPAWRWQRKLMAGGACEASVFCHFGYEATCVCLPLGNYHNMARLAEAQAGTHDGPPRVGREHVAVRDFLGMVDLLVGCGHLLGTVPPFTQRVEKLWTDRAHLLGVSP